MQQISWIFQKPPTVLIWMTLKGSWRQKTTKMKNQKKMPIWAKLFSSLYGWKIPKWNSAQILLWNKSRTKKKYLKIPDLQALTISYVRKMILPGLCHFCLFSATFGWFLPYFPVFLPFLPVFQPFIFQFVHCGYTISFLPRFLLKEWVWSLEKIVFPILNSPKL